MALAAGGYICTTTLRMMVQCWTALPYWDQWDELILGFDRFDPVYWNTLPLGVPHWLFAQHNEHRIAVPRLIFLIDRFLFGSTNKFMFFCNAAVQLSLAALVTCIALRGSGQRIAEKIWIVGAVSALLFSAMQWENFLWGFQVQFLGVALAAVATFATLGLGRPSTARLVAAVGLEGAAVYTLSSGVLVPILAAPLALWARWPLRHVVALSVAGAALFASYLWGYHAPAHNTNPMGALGQMRGLLSYSLSEIGAPFGVLLQETRIHHPLNWSRIGGAAGVVLLAGFAIDMLRQREHNGPVPVLITAALFVLGMALLTALGRMNFGVPLASRYSSSAVLFWALLIGLTMLRLGACDARLRALAMVALLPLPLGLAYYQQSFLAIGRSWVLPRLEATTALLAKVNDAAALARVYPMPNIPWERASLLHARHLSIFAEEWSDWLGTALAKHAPLVDPARCQGAIDQVTPVGASESMGWSAAGWAWDTKRRAVPSRIVIADVNGRVVGYGLAEFAKAGPGNGGGWRGHFAAAQPASVAAYALLDNGSTACRLGR